MLAFLEAYRAMTKEEVALFGKLPLRAMYVNGTIGSLSKSYAVVDFIDSKLNTSDEPRFEVDAEEIAIVKEDLLLIYNDDAMFRRFFDDCSFYDYSNIDRASREKEIAKAVELLEKALALPEIDKWTFAFECRY